MLTFLAILSFLLYDDDFRVFRFVSDWVQMYGRPRRIIRSVFCDFSREVVLNVVRFVVSFEVKEKFSLTNETTWTGQASKFAIRVRLWGLDLKRFKSQNWSKVFQINCCYCLQPVKAVIINRQEITEWNEPTFFIRLIINQIKTFYLRWTNLRPCLDVDFLKNHNWRGFHIKWFLLKINMKMKSYAFYNCTHVISTIQHQMVPV